jgi:ribosomal protein S6--L-glutamate ligase
VVKDNNEMNSVAVMDKAPSALSIGVLVERRYLSQAQPQGMITALRSQGHCVTVIEPQSMAFNIGDDHWVEKFDVVVARGRSWAVLSLLAWAEAHGTPSLNSRAAIAAVHNKSEMAVSLAAHRIPTPLTVLGTIEMLRSRVPADIFPLILKPIFGDNGQGLRVVESPQDLEDLNWPEPVALAQHFVEGCDVDLKLYGIGDEVWAVRKRSSFQDTRNDLPFASRSGDPNPHFVRLTPEMQDLARRCRTAFGLELYGLDCLETREGLVVIEVNDFPNYSGVPQANECLAHFVSQHVMQRRSS